MARTPRDQVSSFERRLKPQVYGEVRMEKIQPPKAQEIRDCGSLKGCGVAGCPVCNPADPSRAGEIKVGDSEVSFFVTETDAADELRRLVEGQMFYMNADGSRWRSSNPERQENPAAKRERELRAKVERYFLKARHQLGWDEVIGNDDARKALLAAIEHPIIHRALFEHYRKKPGRGVVLHGPPGCGKTMFAKAAASALVKLHTRGVSGPVTMIRINGPEIQSPYVGITEQIIRDVFAYARAFRALHGFPLVIFIDEADAILPSRDGTSRTRRALPWEESNVATFLTEMDGIEGSGAFVIIATNRLHAIDGALMRDGRCDRRIKIQRPDEGAAAGILQRAIAGVPLVDGSADELVGHAIAELFHPDRKLLRLRSDRGGDFLRLRDVVSGAMLVGLIERAKELAFERDLGAGGKPSGVGRGDITGAIAIIERENVDLDHSYALAEYTERLGVDGVTAEPLSRGGGMRLASSR